MLNYYLGKSIIPKFLDKAHSGGCASTLGFYAVKTGLVKGMVVSKPYLTFIAETETDFLSCSGSIYEQFKYVKLKRNFKYGQIGKPCNIDEKYKFKISIFCSHVTKKQKFRINMNNRNKQSFFDIPLKCLLCTDHLGLKSDVSVGDSQFNNKLNFIIVNSDLGQKILDEAVNHKYLKCIPSNYELLVKNQPYLYSNIKGKLKWSFTKIRKFL